MVQTSGKDAQMVRQMLLRQIRSGALHGSVVLSYEDEIACVVNGAVLPYDRAFLLESLGSIAKRFPARFGVSNVFHDFRETKRYYDTCRLALAYGELEEPERAVCLFEDYAPRHLEKVLFSRSVNEALLDAHAYEIQRYDNEHCGEFLRTLLLEDYQNSLYGLPVMQKVSARAVRRISTFFAFFISVLLPYFTVRLVPDTDTFCTPQTD